MPKKPDACWKCKHDIYNDNCRLVRCVTCRLYSAEPIERSNGLRVQCKCLALEDGEECPYFEEA